MRPTRWLEEFREDVRFAVRQLRRTPAFTLVAASTLALGIGANSAIFALVDATLLRPLPFRDPGRLVVLSGSAARPARAAARRRSISSTGTSGAARSSGSPASRPASAAWSWPAPTAPPKRCRASG